MLEYNIKRISICGYGLYGEGYAIERTIWTEHKQMKKYTERGGREKIFDEHDNYRTRQKTWLWHIVRGGSLQREIMEGRI